MTSTMRDSSGIVREWHVLAAEMNRKGNWTVVSPDWSTIASAHVPVILVVRIDGQLDDLDDAVSVRRIAAVLDNWKQHGVAVAGVEIDHDCATARLVAYTRFLAALRTQLTPTTKLLITALPAWLDSVALDSLLAEADESVLQVHAVMNPVQGLFDETRARAWMHAFAGRTHHPWRVALPTYGTRVTWGPEGRVIGIESERPVLLADGLAHELIAQPEEIGAFVERIERDRPAGLAGIVWFRLPTDNDDRAWSLATWRAVLTHAPLRAEIVPSAYPHEGHPGLFDVSLASMGNIDAALPGAVRINASCEAADGVNGYALDYDAHGMLLRRVQPGLLHAGTRREIGWLRCNETGNKEVSVHAEP